VQARIVLLIHYYQAASGRLRHLITPVLVYVGVLLLATSLYFVALGERSLWSMELRWAEIPREMRLSSDYFRPTINGRLYYDKPLGSYWLVLAAGWVTGRHDEWAARLPSAIFALMSIALVMHMARRFYDRRTAALTGLILATSFAFVDFARLAASDMANVAGVLAAIDIYLGMRWQPTPWKVVGFWLVMALTSLTKGLLGFALPLIVATADSCLRANDGDDSCGASCTWAAVRRLVWLLSRASILGACLAAFIYLTPFVASGADAGSGLALVFRENIQRFVSPHNHRGAVYLYGYVIFGLLAPWSVFVPAALIQIHGRRLSGSFSEGDRFTRVFFWVIFAFFTLSASRRSYYLLPALPAGALLIARLLTTPTNFLTVSAVRLVRFGFAILTVVLVGAGAALLPPSTLLPGLLATMPAAPERATLAVGWLACLAVVAYGWQNPTPRRIAPSTGVVAALAMAYVFCILLPAAEPFRGERPFAVAVHEIVGARADGLALYHTRELVFDLGYTAPITEYDTPAELIAAARDGRIKWLILRRRDLEIMPCIFTARLEQAEFPWEGPAERAVKLVLLESPGD
jgi:4-amino-4-deoxy-L-arabinose transferase-like glycosyltransferase